MTRFNKIISSTLLAAAIGLLAAPTWAGPEHGHKEDRQRMPGAGFDGRMMDHLAARLDLSDEQRAQVKDILSQGKDDIKSQHEEMRQIREELEAIAHSDDYDADRVATLASRQGQLMAQGVALRNANQHEIWQLLSEEQRAELAELKEQRGNKMRERRGRRVAKAKAEG